MKRKEGMIMTKSDFLYELRKALDDLPSAEIDKTIDYYAEIIDDAVEDGKCESEVIAGLGSAEDIARRIINETPFQTVKRKVKGRKLNPAIIAMIIIGSPVWLSIAISLFAVIFSVYVSVWAVVFSLFVTAAALAASAVAAFIITFPFIPVRPVKAVFAFGAALLCTGLSVLIFYLAMLCAHLMIKLTRVFLKGGRRNEAE